MSGALAPMFGMPVSVGRDAAFAPELDALIEREVTG